MNNQIIIRYESMNILNLIIIYLNYMTSFLKYGQIIRIHCTFNSGQTQILGLITSKSYTDPTLYYQTYKNFKCIANYRESLFQILPNSSFDINDQMNNTDLNQSTLQPRAKTERQQFQTLVKQKSGESIYFGAQVVIKHLDSGYYIHGSFECAKSGIGAFKISLSPKLSSQIVFKLKSFRTYEKQGDEISLKGPIQIYHQKTHCYLSFETQEIFLDKNFLIDEDQQYEVEGQDGLKFKSIRKAIKRSTGNRYELINENISKRVWKFEQHEPYQASKPKEIISPHDLIYFRHTKDNKYLVPNYSNFEVKLKHRYHEQILEDFFDGIWQIQQENSEYQGQILQPQNPRMGSSYRKKMTGTNQNILNTQQRQYLVARHLISGKILMYDDRIKKIITDDKKLIKKSSNVDSQLHITFQQKILEDNTLVNFVYLIKRQNISLYMDVSTKQKEKNHSISIDRIQSQEVIQEEFIQINEQDGNLKNIQQNYQSYFEYEQLGLNKAMNQHGFRIYKFEEEYKKLLLFVLSSQQLIAKFTQFVHYIQQNKSQDKRKKVEQNLNFSLLNDVINTFKNLIGFVYKCQYHQIKLIGNNPNTQRQKIFEELGMIQLITELVICINKTTDYIRNIFKGRQSEYLKIRTIYKLAYQILETIAKNNKRIKFKISYYLNEYLNQMIKHQNKIVYKSLQEVLDDNYIAIEKIVNESIIRKLIESFNPDIQKKRKQIENSIRKDLEFKNESQSKSYIENLKNQIQDLKPDPQNLKFLSILCLCKGRTVQINQNSIFKYFYQSKEQDLNKFLFREDHNKMQISSKLSRNHNPRYRTLPELYQDCEDLAQQQDQVQKTKNHWIYFQEYLNLLADICVHRNIAPQKYVTDILPLSRLVDFLRQPIVKKKNLYQPFIRLVHYVHIQRDGYNQINRLTKVKLWNQSLAKKQKKSMFTAQQKNKQKNIQNILILIMEYIKKINKNNQNYRPAKKLQSRLSLKQKQQQSLENSRHSEKQKNKNQQDQREDIILDPTNMKQLRNIYTFLELLKSTLNLGLWENQNQLTQMKQMVPCMFRILQYQKYYSDVQYENNYKNKMTKEKAFKIIRNNLTLNKPEINLLVKCKILAAQILNIILDNENNVRVSKITKLFKDILQNNVDLNEFQLTEERLMDYNNFLKKNYSDEEYSEFQPSTQRNQKELRMLYQDIWIKKLDQLLQERDIFKQFKKENLNQTLILFQISHYRNQILSNYCLSLLDRLYGQRKEILENFRNIIIVSKGVLFKLSEISPQARAVFLNLASYNILNCSIKVMNNSINNIQLWYKPKKLQPNQKPNIQYQKSIIQYLAFLTMSMKKSKQQVEIENAKNLYSYAELYPYNSYPNEITNEQTYEERTYSIISEKQQNNPLHQNLIKSQDHHQIMYEFIKIMETIQQQHQLPAKILHAVYNFLTVLIWNNKQNKKQLKDFLKIAYNHLKYNIGCIDFYRQMYYNNKQLVTSEGQIPQLVDHIVGTANNLQFDVYYKSKLMDFLRVLLIFDDKGYTKNQNIVMQVISRYQVSQRNKTVYISGSKDNRQQKQSNQKKKESKYLTIDKKSYSEWISIYQKQYLRVLPYSMDIKISAELTYISVFFQIFSALIENQNIINLGKCTNMHEYHWLIDLLSKSGNCWPIIRHLRCYVNKLYYSQNRQIQTQVYQAFIDVQFKNIRDQLLGIVVLKENYPQYSKIKITNPIRYSYLCSYVYLSLQQILFSLEHMLKKSQFQAFFKVNTSQSKEWKESYGCLIQILQMLSYLNKKSDGRYITKFLNQICEILKRFINNFTIEILTMYQSQKKKQILKARSINDDDEITEVRKRYSFDNQQKGFWRHLLDWYSFNKMSKQRQKLQQLIQKKNAQKDQQNKAGGAQETQNQKKKQMLINTFSLGKIQKKIKIKSMKNQKIEKQSNQVVDAINKHPSNQTNQQEKTLEKPVQSINKKNLITSKSKIFKLKNQPQLQPEQQNILINTRKKKLSRFMQLSKNIQNFRMKQFYAFCQKLDQIDADSLEQYNLVIIGAKDVIKSFVQMNQNNPNCIKFQLKLIFLNLLTNYITRNNPAKYKSESADKWKSDQWLQHKQKIKQAQLFLNECNCAKFICTLIKYNLENSIEMANKLFEFGIAFLLGGNSACQDSFMQLFAKDEKNIIFQKIEKVIKISSENVSQPEQINEKVHKFKSKKLTSDTYDFFDDKQSMMIRKFRYQQQIAQERKLLDNMANALSRVYRFIQLLCQGNNYKMKDYIRQQFNQDEKPRSNNINFIQITNIQLRKMFRVLHSKIIHLPLPLIQFINEVTQIPCKENQKVLCKGTFFEDVCYISKSFEQKKNVNINKDHEENLLKIYNKSIEIALSCLQGNQQQIYENMQQKIECQYLVKLIKYNIENLLLARFPQLKKEQLPKQIETNNADKNEKNHKNQQNLPPAPTPQQIQKLQRLQQEKKIQNLKIVLGQNKCYSKQTQQILKIVAVIAKILKWQKNKNKEKFTKHFKNQDDFYAKKIIQLLTSSLLCIQVKQDPKSEPQTIYFPYHPIFKYLSEFTKDFIMFEVNRETPRDKIIGLFKTKQEISKQIEHNFYLDHMKVGMLNVSITSETIKFIRQIAQIISVIICIMIIAYAHVQFYPEDDQIQYDFGKQKYILRFLSILQFSLTCLFGVLWLGSRTPLAQQKYKSQHQGNEIEKKSQQINEEENSQLPPKTNQLDSIIQKCYDYVGKIRLLKILYCLFKYESEFATLLIFFISSFLGTFYRIQFFSLHLIDLVASIDLLTNVFQAVTKNIGILSVVSLLGISFICIFSVYSFNSYVSSIYEEDLPKQACQSVISCIFTLYISQQIGNEMEQFQVFRFGFDLLYVIFMDLLFGNIISSIMIDKFAALRQKKNDIEEDKQQFCFICNISRETLQKSSIELHHHYLNQNHFLWDYVFYLYYLDKKKQQNITFTGLEYIIAEKIEKEDVTWIPLINDDSKDINTQLQDLESDVKKCKQEVEKIEIIRNSNSE